MTDDEAWLGMTHLLLKTVETRPTPGKIKDLAARPQHESGDPHPRFDAPPESLGVLRCVFIEGEFTPMPPLTRLARFRARGAVARAQHPKSRRTAGSGHQK